MALDRRQCLRKRKAVSVCILLGRRRRAVRTRDIGLNGAFLQGTPPALPVSGRIEARLTLPRGDRAIWLEVLRVTPEGVAVRFTRYDGNTYIALMDLLYSA